MIQSNPRWRCDGKSQNLPKQGNILRGESNQKSNAGLRLQSSPCINVLLQQSVGKMIILWIGDNDDFCPE